MDRTKPENALKFEIDFLVGQKQLGKSSIAALRCMARPVTSEVLDDIKAQGYKYSTLSAITVAVGDATIPQEKKEIIAAGRNSRSMKLRQEFRDGLLSDSERYNAVLKTWEKATNDVTDALQKGAGLVITPFT